MKSTLFLPLLPCWIALISLSSCASAVKTIDYAPIREISADASPAPILFRGAEFLIPPGQDIGFESSASRGCGWPKSPITRTALGQAIDAKFLKQGFHDTLESIGYDVVEGLSLSAEESENDSLRAEYTITAKIKNAHVDLCNKESNTALLFFPAQSGISGEIALSIDWSLYDPIRRKVVYKASTEGYTKRRTPNKEGLTLMMHEAIEMAAHNLASDEGFYNLIVHGKPPENNQENTDKTNARRIFDPLEPIKITQNTLSRDNFTKNIAQKRKNAILIHKIGHGSGFFITKAGHIITNAHVVGDSLRTGIVLANKEKRIPVEVLRIDRARDVALLKIENMDDLPAGYDIQIAPIRTKIPKVGEDVYVIGAPLSYAKMQDTLTKGIVSAYRPKYSHNMLKQSYIQSDVEVHAGSSGGPLYDANGNIIGITALSHGAQDSIGNGLNLFIPIAEALDRLTITLESASNNNAAPTKLTR